MLGLVKIGWMTGSCGYLERDIILERTFEPQDGKRDAEVLRGTSII